MKTNKAMSELLLRTSPSGTIVDDEYTHFVEWNDCILISSFARDLPMSLDKTIYSDRTECEASINHLHLENLSIALDIIYEWKKSLISNYPEKSFIIVVSCDVDGSEAVIRFYLSRTDEPSWLNENNLENYKHEAILFLKVSQKH
ncbi:hypothetical protein [Paenibacillus sp. PL91]|uniref:hypothetical protein n=1 Tax=Paenibacillus sp. PL91 TaxID=2729538 RepID=UPI00145DBD72|nr:hypothetical protein [Paenibacillus sp. PL91]MBC9205171.1 hypothetical protein [Paenibacillus sp. PL91]